MSFLDDVVSFGSSLLGGGSGFSGLLGNLAGAALTGYALNQVTSSINKENSVTPTATQPTPDYGVRLQVEPDTQHKIPIVYGRAVLGGIVTDAQLSADKKTMYYCITICEQTGSRMSDGAASIISFKDIYWDDQRLIFNEDGYTVNYAIDRNGVVDRSLSGLVKVFCFSGNSNKPVVPVGYNNGNLQAAYSQMQGWSALHSMDNLIFAIIQVTYNKEKNVSGLGNITFKIENSMNMPGDCVFDYMTNTRYGAGIQTSEIYSG